MSAPLEGDDLTYLRMLIGDTSTDRNLQIFADGDLDVLAAREGGHLKLAAAAALDLIAGSELMLGKRIKSQDLSTDGVAVAKALTELADRLRAQHAASTEDAAWGVATWTYPDTNARHPEATERPALR